MCRHEVINTDNYDKEPSRFFMHLAVYIDETRRVYEYIPFIVQLTLCEPILAQEYVHV